ncbi:hypothetical protein B0J11DRAFT_537976 [Dendryphion nanum]|uniref:GmrSD restriction endonucleases N-terminal domain-containing protein n=1 Tax=Dendryphion nanum TaxID=256645 RepID=A0A9P9IDP4_9PLEO|nr:hypothetical protein B0J11DRAFT_537976 [Dendryphion nanum]
MPGLAMEPLNSQHHVKDEGGDDYLTEDAGESEDASLAFDPRPRLSEPAVYMRTLAYLMNGLETGKIDVNPEYQREVVWTADRMAGLVNSLMENFYIPPIILNRKTIADSDSEESTLVCVDGKQRLSSVRAFIQGLIPCHDRHGIKWWFCIAPGSVGKSKRILPEEVRRQFLRKEFCSFEYQNISTEQEEDLFARVQMGMQLSAAEKMRAQSGPWQELARLFVDDYPIVFSLLKDRSRGKDFQMALSCFSQIIECEHPMAANGIPVLRTNHIALPKLINNKAAADDRTRAHLANVFNTFQDLINENAEIFTNAGRRLKNVQTFAPVEMVSVAVMISIYSETRNNTLLLGDIKVLRDLLRENFVDLRLNAQVWKVIWEFIDNLEGYRGVIPGNEIDRTARPKPPVGASGIETPRSGTQKRKRQRADNGTPAMQTTLYPPHPPFSGIHTDGATDSMNVLDEITHLDAMASDDSSVEPHRAISAVKQEPTEIPMPSATKPKPRKTPIPFPVLSGSPASTALSASPRPNTTPKQSAPLSTRKAALNPSEARRNRIAELDSYRVPTASMSSPAPSSSRSKPTKQRTNNASSSKPAHASPLLNESQIQHRLLDNSIPSHTSPPTRSFPAHLRAQTDNTIDLTSDTENEEERMSLLTSFRKPVQNPASRSPAAKTAVGIKKENMGTGTRTGEGPEDVVMVDRHLPVRTQGSGPKKVRPIMANPYKKSARK